MLGQISVCLAAKTRPFSEQPTPLLALLHTRLGEKYLSSTASYPTVVEMAQLIYYQVPFKIRPAPVVPSVLFSRLPSFYLLGVMRYESLGSES